MGDNRSKAVPATKSLFWAAAALFGLLASLLTTALAQEPARFALLIGNQGYSPDVGPLKNTHQDIKVVGTALKKLGFKVVSLPDADYRKMDIAIRRHVRQVRNAGSGTVSFVYYSGHGIANPNTGNNYLVPVDVGKADTDNIWDESFEQSLLIDRLNRQAPQAIHFVVLDACRNELNLTSSGTKALGAEKGFRPVNDVRGMLIAYATAERQTAADTGDFARILAEEIVRPGSEAVSAFRRVQLRVEETLGQEPWMSLRYLPETYLAGKEAAPPPAPETQPQPPLSEAARAWENVKELSDLATLEAFRDQFGADYPFYDRLAERRIQALREDQVAISINSEPREEATNYVIAMQTELKRVGCYLGEVDGDWGPQSEAALSKIESLKRVKFAEPIVSSINLGELRKIDSGLCKIPKSTSPKPSVRNNPPSAAQTEKRESASVNTKTTNTLSTCYQRAQRYCSNPDNSSAIGYQACMTQAKKGCRDQ